MYVAYSMLNVYRFIRFRDRRTQIYLYVICMLPPAIAFIIITVVIRMAYITNALRKSRPVINSREWLG